MEISQYGEKKMSSSPVLYDSIHYLMVMMELPIHVYSPRRHDCVSICNCNSPDVVRHQIDHQIERRRNINEIFEIRYQSTRCGIVSNVL
jgi:hypothetical protein